MCVSELSESSARKPGVSDLLFGSKSYNWPFYQLLRADVATNNVSLM